MAAESQDLIITYLGIGYPRQVQDPNDPYSSLVENLRAGYRIVDVITTTSGAAHYTTVVLTKDLKQGSIYYKPHARGGHHQ